MTTVAPAANPRGSKAVAIVATDKWKFFRDAEGRPSWSIPSSRQRGLFYRVTDNGCTCPDLRYRPWLACKHMLAVRLQLELDQETNELVLERLPNGEFAWLRPEAF
jgi:hypothetical protein